MHVDCRKPSICVLGHLAGRNPGYITTQGQIVAALLERDGYRVVSSSSRLNRIARLGDIVLTTLFRGINCDVAVVEVYSGKSMVLAAVASWLSSALRLPLVMVLHGGNLPEFFEENPSWCRRVLGRAGALVAPSDYLAEQIGSRGFRVYVIPNVIDLGPETHRTRRELKPKLFWMRSFHTIYNPQMALGVLADLIIDYPEATLVMAGADKGLMEEIKKLARDLGLAENISFPGFLDDGAKRDHFAAADIFLNTNHIDNMPVSVVEAAANGLAIVATDVGGLRHLIADGVNGLLVPDGDVKAMAAAVRKLLREPELAEKLSRNGLELAQKSSWAKVRDKWLRLFLDVVNQKTKDFRSDDALRHTELSG